jgi:hypothetical protein
MKRSAKKCIFFIVIGFLFTKCQIDVVEEVNEKQNKYKINEYSLEKANRIQEFFNANLKITKELNKKRAKNKGGKKGEDLDFTVDPTTVKEISIGDYTSYTMLVKRAEPTKDYFENLIVEVDAQNKTNAYLVKYTPSKPVAYVKEHDAYDFEGTMTSNKIVDPGDNPGDGTGIYDGPCYTVIKCSYGGKIHYAGLNCTDTFPVLQCTRGDIQVVPYYDHGNITGPSGGSGTTTTPTPPVTTPVFPPTNTYAIHENCEELKQLGNKASDKPDIKADVDYLKEKVKQKANLVEFGVEFKKELLVDGTFKYHKTRVTNNLESSVELFTGTAHIGGAHSHPQTGYSMFSYGDLKFLVTAYDDASPGRKPEVVLIMVSKDKITGSIDTYAIKVDNIAVLRKQVYDIWDSPDYIGMNEKNKIIKIHEEQAIKYERDKKDLEKSFLQQFGGTGFSLYKASDDSMTKWDNLQLEPNPIAPNKLVVTKKPCN